MNAAGHTLIIGNFAEAIGAIEKILFTSESETADSLVDDCRFERDRDATRPRARREEHRANHRTFEREENDRRGRRATRSDGKHRWQHRSSIASSDEDDDGGGQFAGFNVIDHPPARRRANDTPGIDVASPREIGNRCFYRRGHQDSGSDGATIRHLVDEEKSEHLRQRGARGLE